MQKKSFIILIITFKALTIRRKKTSHAPKTYVDLKKSQYNEIDENVYEKIKTELPMENTNAYEQFQADIPLNDIGSVKINKGDDNSDGFKKELVVSANEKKVILSSA